MQTTNKEQYRIILAEPIISDNNSVRFDFSSNYERDKERYVSEQDKDEGTFIVTDTLTGKKYNGTYELKYRDDNCKFILKFNDFAIRSTDFSADINQKMLLDDFDKTVQYLKSEFPPFSKFPERGIHTVK